MRSSLDFSSAASGLTGARRLLFRNYAVQFTIFHHDPGVNATRNGREIREHPSPNFSNWIDVISQSGVHLWRPGWRSVAIHREVEIVCAALMFLSSKALGAFTG